MASFSIKFNANKRKLNKKGQAPLSYEIYLAKGKRTYVATGYSLKPTEWNSKKQQVTAKHPHYLHINAHLNKMLKNLEEAYYKAIANDQPFSLEDARRVINGKTGRYKFSELAWKMYEADEGQVSDGYLRHQKSVIKYFIDYSRDMYVEDITVRTVQQYDAYLKSTGKSKEWIYGRHRNLRKLLNYAIRREVITNNPYNGLKIERGTSKDRTGLTFTELNEIENYQPREPTLATEKDIFLFACYTGVRFGDLMDLRNENLEDDPHDGLTLSFVMNKSEHKRGIPVTLHLDKLFNGRPGEIARKYKGEDKADKLFPQMTNQHANRYLKIIQHSLNIKQILSTHIARHTFCSRLAEINPDPYLIKQLAGHSDIRTSMIYIHQSKASLGKKLDATDWSRFNHT